MRIYLIAMLLAGFAIMAVGIGWRLVSKRMRRRARRARRRVSRTHSISRD